MKPVYILGGSQSDFARNLAREGRELFDLFREVLADGLEQTGLDARHVGVGHVGNFVSELFTGQAHLGGFFAEADGRFKGMPAVRHEAACASGSMAVLAAMADIESGRYSCACVLGIEQMRNVDGETAADHLAAAAWRGRESEQARYLWPAQFAELARVYDERYGLKRDWLVELSRNAFANARRNPLAQTRKWTVEAPQLSEDDEANPLIEGCLRKQDCGQMTDGAAMVVLADAEFTRAWCRKHGHDLGRIPRISGWGHTGAPLRLHSKLDGDNEPGPMLPHVGAAFSAAIQRAGLKDANQLDAIELHDCFSITGYMLLDHLDLAPPGQAWQVIERGIGLDGPLPVNPGGGLIGLGHPVGATGVRMLNDAARQVRGEAGDNQVEGARHVATLNVGGSATTVASLVVSR